MKLLWVLAAVVFLQASVVLSRPVDDDPPPPTFNLNEEIDKEPVALEDQEIDDATRDKIQEDLRHLDSINVEDLLKRTRVVAAHIDCVLGTPNAPCDAVGKRLKYIIPYMLVDQCESCTSQQRGKMIKMAKSIKYNHPDRYKKLIEKFNDGEEPPELEAL